MSDSRISEGLSTACPPSFEDRPHPEHRIASGVRAVLFLALAGLASGCREQARPSPVGPTGAPGPDEQRRPEETPRQLSYRMLPVLRPQSGGDTARAATLEAPLLVPDAALGIAADWMLRRIGANRPPSPEELESMAALGQPLAALGARNLREMLTQLLRNGGVMAAGAKEGKPLLLLVATEPYAVHSLVLVPEFWEQCEKQLGGPVWALIPERGVFSVLRRDNPAALRAASEEMLRRFTKGSMPICGRMVGRSGSRLVAGPSYAELAPPESEDGR